MHPTSTLEPAIVAIELYAPKTAISMGTLEEIQSQPEGRYSAGLQQREMTVASGFEDAVSMALTAVERLLEREGVDKKLIGRIDVGSESNPDASKSIKSTIAGTLGMTNAEGADHVNACYGGTDALFSSIDWLRTLPPELNTKLYALVVATDLAEYDTPSAIPSGGGGCVVLLLKNCEDEGAVIKNGIRGTITENVYDFCKPPGSMYPFVRGKFSIDCYIAAFEKVYYRYKEMLEVIHKNEDLKLKSFSGVAFHSPFTKLAVRSLALLEELHKIEKKKMKEFPSPSIPYNDLSGIISKNSELQTEISRLSKSFDLNMFTGNCYTASWLVSLTSCFSSEEHMDKGGDILVYSYGSGCIASMFILSVKTKPRVHSNICLEYKNNEIQKSSRLLLNKKEYNLIETFKKQCKESQFKHLKYETKEKLESLVDNPEIWCKKYLEEGIYVLLKCSEDGERVYSKI